MDFKSQDYLKLIKTEYSGNVYKIPMIEIMLFICKNYYITLYWCYAQSNL